MIFNIGDSLFPDVINEFRNNWQNLWLYILGKGGDRSALGFTSRCLRTLLNTISGIAQLVFRAVVALSLGLINVIVWVIVVFSTASPMILSGLYEAAIDRQVLSAIEREIRHYQSLRKRTGGSYATNELYRIRYQVHLLYAILVGNLELWEKPGDTISDTTTPSSPVDISENGSGAHPPPPNFKDESTIDQPRVPQPTSEAWKHISEILDKMDTGSPTHRFNAQTRLNTMLECQASFGATIGAPIAFFLGAFLLSVESNVNQYGDNDDSHALAFGEWWMTIPHVAIVSGCLLAGNNPNTLEAIYSGVRDTFDALRGHHDNEKTFRSTGAVEGDSSDHLAGDVHSSGPRRIPPALERLWDNIYKPFYNSHYQPVWMWERGRSKRNWIQAVQEIKAYESAKFGTGGEPSRLRRASTLSRQSSRAQKILAKLRELWYISRIQHRLQDVPSLGLIGWAFLVFEAIIIIIIPCVLAFITSYFTPAVGLSCRTLTFVIYFAFQFWLTCLWAIDFENIVHSRLYAGKSGCPSVFSIAIVFGFCGSAFCAVAGTIMQIMGVYRNCKCNIPLSAWASGDFSFAISSNSAAMIYYAKRYWLATGVASIAQLLVFCYSGWWYQRHWRQRFNKVVKDVLDVRDVLANGDRHDRGKIVNGHKKELAGGNAVDKALENKEAMTPVTTGRERNVVDDMSIEPA
ncbi:hypothetical protein GQ53DRAFT_849690 [Thozetella sp. PMI_491]|nr:hypothetical protein GQ53DRAFT_849690 [Thozetella sp. PMI_491]